MADRSTGKRERDSAATGPSGGVWRGWRSLPSPRSVIDSGGHSDSNDPCPLVQLPGATSLPDPFDELWKDTLQSPCRSGGKRLVVLDKRFQLNTLGALIGDPQAAAFNSHVLKCYEVATAAPLSVNPFKPPRIKVLSRSVVDGCKLIKNMSSHRRRRRGRRAPSRPQATDRRIASASISTNRFSRQRRAWMPTLAG